MAGLTLKSARSPLCLVLDAGTSAGRALVFDDRGCLLAEETRPWRYETPADAAPWGRELDPDRFWALLCEASRAALSACGAEAVSAVAATAQRQATVLLDAAGRELYAGPNVDLRAAFEGLRLLEEHGPRIHAITGHLPPMMFASARWLWFRRHRPELCERAARLLMMADWLTWRLCGRAITEPSNAVESGLFDVTARAWSVEWTTDLGMPAAILPQVAAAGTVAGQLTPAAGAALGLAPGVPVVVAGADTACGLLGMAVTRPGQSGLVAGWSAPAQMITERPIFDPQRALWTTCTALVGQWALEGNAGPAGSAHRWACELFLPGGDYAAFDALAASAPAAARGALAFLGPRVADYDNPQLLWGGMFYPQANDLLAVGRAELARATLENVAFAVKANLERVEAVAGKRTTELCLGGGLARSRLFARILADVLGRPVQTSAEAAVSGLGAAMCAAVGAGEYDDLVEAAMAMSRPGERFAPESVAQAEYLDAYERWLQVYHNLENLSGQLV